MGGALAFAAAQHVPEITAASPWYGTPAREMPWIEPDQIKIPVQYHTGARLTSCCWALS
jgi:dienelactone hydrolase